jgi:hypothetical protein
MNSRGHLLDHIRCALRDVIGRQVEGLYRLYEELPHGPTGQAERQARSQQLTPRSAEDALHRCI